MEIAGVSQSILSFGILLLCPIMHLLMMRNMKHDAANTNIKSQMNEDKEEEFT